jgi:hypothetical protein
MHGVEGLPCNRVKHTIPIILVVVLPVDERPQLLKVLLGLVQRNLERAHLFELVGAPLSLVGEHQVAQGLAKRIRDLGQQRPDRVVDAHRRNPDSASPSLPLSPPLALALSLSLSLPLRVKKKKKKNKVRETANPPVNVFGQSGCLFRRSSSVVVGNPLDSVVVPGGFVFTDVLAIGSKAGSLSRTWR